MKKGVSAIIATVLIVMISVFAVAILWQFIIPTVKENLKKSTSEKVQLSIETAGGYTTWDEVQKIARVQVKRGNDKTNLTGIDFSFIRGGNSKKNQTDKVPQPGQTKVYEFNLSDFGKPEKVTIAPITAKGTGSVVSQGNSFGNYAVGNVSCVYDSWSACNNSGKQNATKNSSLSSLGCIGELVKVRDCPTCTSFTYTDWSSSCNASGVRNRTILTYSPSGCINGNPILTNSSGCVAASPVTHVCGEISSTGYTAILNCDSPIEDGRDYILTNNLECSLTILSDNVNIQGNYCNLTGSIDASGNHEEGYSNAYSNLILSNINVGGNILLNGDYYTGRGGSLTLINSTAEDIYSQGGNGYVDQGTSGGNAGVITLWNSNVSDVYANGASGFSGGKGGLIIVNNSRVGNVQAIGGVGGYNDDFGGAGSGGTGGNITLISPCPSLANLGIFNCSGGLGNPAGNLGVCPRTCG